MTLPERKDRMPGWGVVVLFVFAGLGLGIGLDLGVLGLGFGLGLGVGTLPPVRPCAGATCTERTSPKASPPKLPSNVECIITPPFVASLWHKRR